MAQAAQGRTPVPGLPHLQPLRCHASREGAGAEGEAMSDTPRSDTVAEQCVGQGSPMSYVRAIDLCRELERELTAFALLLSLTRTILAGTDAGSLPDDFPVDGMAAERMKDLLNARRELTAALGVADRQMNDAEQARIELAECKQQLTAALGDAEVARTAYEQAGAQFRAIGNLHRTMYSGVHFMQDEGVIPLAIHGTLKVYMREETP